MSNAFFSMQAPAWLPCRVRNAWDNARVARAIQTVDATPVGVARPQESARAEVQMLLCRRDLRLAVLALKSLLEHTDLGLSVSVTDDGSLREADRRFFDAQIRNARWLDRVSRDPAVERALEGRPHLSALYSGDFSFARRLVHPFALARSPRVIQLDADTLFLTQPAAFHAWLDGKGPRHLFLRDIRDERADVPIEARRAIADLWPTVVGPSVRLSVPSYFFNAGLLAFHPAELDLDVAERFLSTRETLPESLRRGPAGIWFGDWTREQMCFLLMFAATGDALALDDSYRIGFHPDATFCHFLRSNLGKPVVLRCVADHLAARAA